MADREGIGREQVFKVLCYTTGQSEIVMRPRIPRACGIIGETMRYGTQIKLALPFITLVVALSACSSKDVKTSDVGDAPPAMASMPSGNVGSQPVNDLETVHFPFDSYVLPQEARDALKREAEWMKANPTTEIQIEGHCDERGSVEYNLALGERRANAVREYLTRLGVDASKLSVISYGKERLADPGHDEAAWAQDRRATPIKLSAQLSGN